MTKRVKWSVTAAIVLMIAGMIAYPQIKSRMKDPKMQPKWFRQPEAKFGNKF